MKKYLLIFMSLVFVFVLSACVKKDTKIDNNFNTNTQNQNTGNIDVSKHNTENDCWTIVNGSVYNISDYVTSKKHPGGSNIKSMCGQDGTEIYNSLHKHSKSADNLLGQYKVQ